MVPKHESKTSWKCEFYLEHARRIRLLYLFSKGDKNIRRSGGFTRNLTHTFLV